jgi:hypothetical protein
MGGGAVLGRVGNQWCGFEAGFQHGLEPFIAGHPEAIGPTTSGFQSFTVIVGGEGLDAFEAAKCLFFMGFLGK